MKKKELLNIVGCVVLICLSFFFAAWYYFKNNTICTICGILIGSRNVFELVRRIKNSKKEDYEINSNNHTD